MSATNGISSGAKGAKAGRCYWSSFEHLAESPEIARLVENEFAGYDPSEIVAPSRRSLLKYAAASLALAGVGLSGCRRWPQEHVAPYAHDVRGRTPGIADYYATSWELGGVGHGLLVSSYDGRPIKIEGNPLHPDCVVRSGQWAATGLIDQAQTLSLYDPDRSRAVNDRTAVARGEQPGRSVSTFLEQVIPQLRSADPRRMAVLSEASASPTFLRLRKQFEEQFAGAQWYTYEPLATPSLAAATQAAAGQPLRPIYHLEKATAVVSIDDDYLGLHPAAVRHAADWAVLRASADEEHPRMSKCHIAESRYSLTGGASDYRLPVRPSWLPAIAGAIAAGLGVQNSAAGVQLEEREREFVERAVHDLREAGSSGLLAWGAHLPAGLQVLCMRINHALANAGTTLTYIPDPIPPAGTIAHLVDRIAADEIDTLIIIGGNPVYDAPADLEFGELLKSKTSITSVHLSLYLDETGIECTYHVPRAHFLESWGDTRGWKGTIAPVQPLIMPLYNGLSAIELLAALLGLPVDGRALVRETLLADASLNNVQGDGETRFRTILHDGVVPNSELPPVETSIRGGEELPLSFPAATESGFELVFGPDCRLYDGRFANNGWLQEMPETLTKLTWDNAALLNIEDAEALGVSTFDVINIKLPAGGRELGMAVYVMPGQPKGAIGLSLGFGRWRAGNIGSIHEGEPGDGGGFNTYRLRTGGGMWTAAGATAAPQGQRYQLAMTQNHHLIDKLGFEGAQKRVGKKGQTSTVVHETTFAQHQAFLQKQPGVGEGNGNGHNGHGYPAHAGAHGGVTLQIFNPPHHFRSPHAWGMTIDMNACTGCGACVVACVAENNVPVVGKEQVLNNREMHWLRLDRYFKSEGESYEEQVHDPNPDVVVQPMMCVHCENAPCEQVCPVAATVHDAEGLNVMVYNRCIGTRYCSNNCPYKVRKFNYLDWWAKDPRKPTYDATWLGMPDQQQNTIDAIKQMVFNPEVTVRMRGVMEKCTYCVQRIKLKTNWRRNRRSEQYPQGEPLLDGDIKTACQMACPTEAIIFGDLLDPEARVTHQQTQPRAYAVLDELNTRPRTKHLARLRNRAPAVQADIAH